jgi:uncharacterized protein YkwD
MMAKRPTAQRSLVFASLAAALALAGCGGMGSVTGSGVASMNATGYLAAARAEHGLSSAAPDRKLEQAALEQARYMARAGSMSHTTGWRRDFSTRMKSNSVDGIAAENVAYGGMELGKLFEMWMDSAPHRKNMLDPRFGHFGLASATDAKGKRYWALVLGE